MKKVKYEHLTKAGTFEGQGWHIPTLGVSLVTPSHRQQEQKSWWVTPVCILDAALELPL